MSVPLLVFADDWGRHPSSCQHLIRELLPNHPVTWVNTIGTRAPRLNLDTFRRAAGKFRQWFRPENPDVSAAPPEGLSVSNPKMWPWLTRKIDRRINRELLLRQLGPVVRNMPALPVAITALPVVADLMGSLPVRRWVYYCVDDFGQWPGLDRKTMARLEKVVVEKADTIVAVSENLRARLKSMGRDSELLTHGVDTQVWASHGDPLPEITGLDRPLVVFWGVVDRRMDTAWVRQLSADLSQGTIVLAGPSNEPDPALRSLPRVRMTGPLAFGQLPTLAREAAVLVMPYADQPVTRAMQPLKLKEYLATGRPAVARNLPANLEWADSLDLTDSAAEFSRLVRRRLETGPDPAQSLARTRLTEEGWAMKARRFAELTRLDED